MWDFFSFFFLSDARFSALGVQYCKGFRTLRVTSIDLFRKYGYNVQTEDYTDATAVLSFECCIERFSPFTFCFCFRIFLFRCNRAWLFIIASLTRRGVRCLRMYGEMHRHCIILFRHGEQRSPLCARVFLFCCCHFNGKGNIRFRSTYKKHLIFGNVWCICEI